MAIDDEPTSSSSETEEAPDAVLVPDANLREVGGELAKTTASILFDLFSVSLSLADIVTDILITVAWYKTGYYTYFGLSLTIFFLAHIAYCVLAGVYYDVPWRARYYYIFIIIPFAQLVPLLMWAESIGVPLATAIGDKLRRNQRMDVDPANLPGGFAAVVKRKFKSHGGFITESFVEAIPQSLLQLVFIMRVGDVSPLNLFSISMSILSVASKGFAIAFHSKRRVFLFNYLCVVFDIVAGYAIVLWAFAPSECDTATFWNFGGKVCSTLSALWLWKTILIIVVALVAIALFSVLFVVMKLALWRTEGPCNHGDQVAEECGIGIASAFIVVCGALPFLVFVEVKLTYVALELFKSVPALGASTCSFVDLYDFILAAPTPEDKVERMRCGILAQGLKEYELQHRLNLETTLDRVCNNVGVYPGTARLHRHVLKVNRMHGLRYVLTTPKEEFTIRQFRKETKMRWWSQSMRAIWHVTTAHTDNYWPLTAMMWWITYIGFPVLILTDVYSAMFPFLALAFGNYSGDDTTLLAKSLTYCLIVLLVVLAALLPSVWQIGYLETNMMEWGFRVNETVDIAMDFYAHNDCSMAQLVELYNAKFAGHPVPLDSLGLEVPQSTESVEGGEGVEAGGMDEAALRAVDLVLHEC